MVTEENGTEPVMSEAEDLQQKEGDDAAVELKAAKEAEKTEEKIAPATPTGKTAPAVPTPYTPNYKFKALDKEQEFDEWMKASIKDADTEKKARDLYTRAYGLDSIKADRDGLKEKYSAVEQRSQQQDQLIRSVTDRIAKKDYDAVFEGLGIPENDILSQAMKILQVRNMTPEQKQAYNQSREASQRSEMLEYQNQMLSQNYQQVAVKARTQELDWTLQRPEFAQVSTAYDNRVGIQGAFKDVVIERAKYHALSSGQDLTPEQAISEVIRIMGGPQSFASPSPSQTAATVVPEPKPVITNIQGRGTSPAKKVYTKLSDLKKLSKERGLNSASNE